MRKIIESFLGGYELYKTRRKEFYTAEQVPFRVSPQPLELTNEQKTEIFELGEELTNYVEAVQELYEQEIEVRKILNKGKPESLLFSKTPQYLFIRPDIIITETGFIVCEIETSVFGLGLAELLNKSYRSAGFDTLIENGVLSSYIKSLVPSLGILAYSNKTASFSGQVDFLANTVFSGEGFLWEAKHVDSIDLEQGQGIYRAFYQSEYLADPQVKSLMEKVHTKESFILPSLTPHIEEKAVLSFIWDMRWEEFFLKRLGKKSFEHLRKVIPPTWIVGEEKYFSSILPLGVTQSSDLASLSRSRRNFVLKSSGFSPNSSWAEGVYFLHKFSQEQAEKVLKLAENNTSTLFIVQEFRKGKNIQMTYEVEDKKIIPMNARVRLTPYYSMMGAEKGKLIAVKATGCENTDLIHASSTSINTAVS